MKYVEINDENPWHKIRGRSHIIACCDCGLTHLFKFRVRANGNIEFTALRQERRTAALRRNPKYPCKRVNSRRRK